MGFGPLTGRGAGFCAGFGIPGYMNRGIGWGRGTGWFGRQGGWRNRYYATGVPGWLWYGNPGWAPQPIEPEVEQEMLKRQAEILQSSLEAVKKRLDAISTAPKE